jgi:hypothetical protein
MLRWLVSASLEDFFALISRRAQENHWRYRKAFWSAYLKRGVIGHAWVILGWNAEGEARRQWRDAMPAHGRLTGADPDHSVLLLQIGTVIVVEFSHMGACRLWRQNDQHCPRFYQQEYPRAALRLNPGYELAHRGSASYAWQRELADTIRSETGIGITQADYQVR